MPKLGANLPLELLNKHRETLGLVNPIVIDTENALLDSLSTARESAIIFLPKSKGLISMTLALVSGIVAEEGTIVLVGTNDAGIGSVKKLYETNIGLVEQKIVGSHSAMYVGKNKRLGAGKKLEDFISFSPLSYKSVSLEVANIPGVFSNGTLDEGTKLLLDNIPYGKKKILDVGSGAGIMGTIYKIISSESDVVMTDSSKIAVLATEKTIEKNGVTAKVVLSDVFSNISDGFDLILTNPPFHKGVATDYSFIESFARDARKRLNKGGEVYVVANSFLPYKEILEKGIGPTEIVVDTKKFRVLKSTSR